MKIGLCLMYIRKEQQIRTIYILNATRILYKVIYCILGIFQKTIPTVMYCSRMVT